MEQTANFDVTVSPMSAEDFQTWLSDKRHITSDEVKVLKVDYPDNGWLNVTAKFFGASELNNCRLLGRIYDGDLADDSSVTIDDWHDCYQNI